MIGSKTSDPVEVRRDLPLHQLTGSEVPWRGPVEVKRVCGEGEGCLLLHLVTGSKTHMPVVTGWNLLLHQEAGSEAP